MWYIDLLVFLNNDAGIDLVTLFNNPVRDFMHCALRAILNIDCVG